MIGRSVPMVDARPRVTGAVEYALNLELPGMLHGCLLRSPHPHARVLHVDTSKAAGVPGVAAVLSRDDLLSTRCFDPYFGTVIQDRTPVALDKVRYVGDPVAAVAAIDEEVAREALELIDVEYEELPAVFEPEQALAPGAPVIHEGPRRISQDLASVALRSPEGTNVVYLFTQRKGEIGRGLEEADEIVEGTYTGPAVAHVPLEPHVAVARVVNGQVAVWTSTQSPHGVRRDLARIFRLPLSDVRVIVTTLGGAYGGKADTILEPVTALLAWKAGRPVRVALPRDEEFLVSTQHASRITLTTGVKRDGTLLAQRALCYFNCGAYAESSPYLVMRAYACTGPYRVPHVHVDSYGTYTNQIPAGAFRGYGITQVAWAHESHMDLIADTLDVDPVELRQKNLLRAGEPFSTGEPIPELHLSELVREAADAIGWEPGRTRVVEGERVRAKGIAAIVKGMTGFPSSAAVNLNEDGSLNVLTSSVEMGQGAKTALAQIAADAAGLALERVRISEPDTAVTPYDEKTVASRTTTTMGAAIRLAVDDVRAELLELAAEQLEVAPDDLEVANGGVRVVGVPERSRSYGEVIQTAGRGSLHGHGFYGPTGRLDVETGQGVASPQWHPAVAACELLLDPETGKVELERLHLALYVGRQINPRLCELQVEGSACMALGQTLFEEIVTEQGQMLNPNLSEYLVPSFLDLPRKLTVHILEVPGDEDVHGIGETALPPVRAAIGNALSRALGARLADLPLTPERVLSAADEHARAGAEPLIAAR